MKWSFASRGLSYIISARSSSLSFPRPAFRSRALISTSSWTRTTLSSPRISPLISTTPIKGRRSMTTQSTATHLTESSSSSPFIVASNPLDKLLNGFKRTKLDSDGKQIEYAVFEKKIENSPNDDRQYRLIMLSNGMECLLISDPKADKAAAAMDVKVGHLSDPEDLQGLAHFCEHLMFMGTEKYPKENDYTEFLTQHGGSSNAFTGLDQTCYYFDIEPSSLGGALDRFAQFFISPLFDPSCTEREANAVHSENSKNLQSDMWRFYQLDKSTSSKTHAYWRFGTGNKESLGFEPVKEGLDTRKRLIDWHEKHYSANLCKLVVLAKDPLDDLTKTIVEKFTPAQNRALPQPEFLGSPYTEAELCRTLYVKSVKDSRQLELTFPFPDESAYYATKPGSFLSHLIGHEGQGSILSLLKKKGWANSMSAGAGNGANGFEFFKIHVDLTAEGLTNHEQVSAIIFAYFDLLRSTPPQEWAFEEVSQLSKLAFRFKEKASPTNTTMSIALSMSRPFPRERLLSAPWLSTEWNFEIVQKLIRILKPDNCRIIVSAQQPIEGKTYEQKEYWYGTEYTIEKMSDKLLKPGLTKYPELHLPKPNEFVPTNIEIKNKVEVAEPAKRPLSLRNTPIARLWHKKDDRWWVPRAGVFIVIRTPIIDDTALHAVQSRLVTELVRDALAEYSYDAELAGLSYTFDLRGDGIVLTFDGYDDKLALLAKVVVEKLKNFQVDKERFDIIMDQLKRAYINNRLDQPYNHALMTAGQLVTELFWTMEQQLAELDNITVENLTTYKDQLFSRAHIEMLVHGNMLKDEAISLCKMIETTLNPSPLTPKELLSHRAVIPPIGDVLTRSKVYNISNDQSAIEQMTYIGDIYDDAERCKLAIFATIVSEPLFDQLRTQQQLGYIVSSGIRRSIGFMGFRVIVQSDRDATFVEERVDQFWNDYLKTLQDMSEEEFTKYKKAVIAKKLEDHKNMWDESSFFWLLIQSGWYDFEQRTREAKVLETIQKKDIVDFFQRHFLDSEKKRRISVHLNSQRLETARLAQLGPIIQNLGLPVPVEDLQKLVASRPTLDQVKAFAQQMLQQAGKDEATIESILGQVDQLLTTRTAPEGVRIVEESERDAFKSELERGPYATPIADYSDLIQKM